MQDKRTYLLCIYSIYTLFVAIQVFYNSNFATVHGGFLIYGLSYLCLLIFLSLIVFSLPVIIGDKQKLLAFIILGTIFGISFIHGRFDPLLYMFLVPFVPLIVGGQNFLLLDFKARMISVITLIVLSPVLGTNIVINHANGHIRNSLGFANPNGTALMALILCIEVITLRQHFKRATVWLVNVFGLIIIVGIAQSRTSMMTYMLFILLYVFFDYKKDISELFRFLLSLVPEFMFVLSYILAWMYVSHPNGLLDKMNSLLSNRLALTGYFLNNYSSTTLWGQKLMFDKDGRHIGALDNAYVNILLRKGIIPTLVVLLILSLTIYKLGDHKHKKYLAAFITLVVVGFTETLLFNFSYNPFLMMSVMILITSQTGMAEDAKENISES